MNNSLTENLEHVRLLVARLERLSADSTWARRASGARGALLRWLERLESISAGTASPLSTEDQERLQRQLAAGFDLLVKAGRELPYPDPRRFSGRA